MEVSVPEPGVMQLVGGRAETQTQASLIQMYEFLMLQHCCATLPAREPLRLICLIIHPQL